MWEYIPENCVNIIFQYAYVEDIPNFPKSLSATRNHIMYNTGIVQMNEKWLADEDYQKLYNNSIVFYGDSGLDGSNEDGTQFNFENWLIQLSEEIRIKVDNELNKWLESFIRNGFKDVEKSEKLYDGKRRRPTG